MTNLQNFELIRSGVDPRPILAEIQHLDDPWGMDPSRQKMMVQRESMSISIRGLVRSMIAGRKRRHVHESRDTSLGIYFPAALQFVNELASTLNSELGRVRLVNLPPGNRVYPHVDRGEYYAVRNRYHLVLQSSSDGSYVKSGNEEVRMRVGELWWFENNLPHEAYNDTDDRRIHLIFDMMPIEMRKHLSGDPLRLKPGTILDGVIARESWTPA